MRHGWTTVSFQLLESPFRYWFEGDDAFVAYVDTGGAWVAGGAPVAPEARLAEVAAQFCMAAREAGRRPSFFGCEQRFATAMATSAHTLQVGVQPVWAPAQWSETLASAGAASLRYQLKRARGKGVSIRRVTAAEVADPAGPLRAAIEALGAEWLASRRMAPMGFLVALEPIAFGSERVMLVAERAGGEIVGFLSAAPVYARRRLFVEHLLRARTAPNGTNELLFDAVTRVALERGDAAVTLGLAPLAGSITPVLRLARALSRPLYDFRGLHSFKRKLRPDSWEPVFLVTPRSRALGLFDGLVAFAGGDLIGFVVATLARRRVLVLAVVAVAVLLLALLLLAR